jgi:hypothetical protein
MSICPEFIVPPVASLEFLKIPMGCTLEMMGLQPAERFKIKVLWMKSRHSILCSSSNIFMRRMHLLAC